MSPFEDSVRERLESQVEGTFLTVDEGDGVFIVYRKMADRSWWPWKDFATRKASRSDHLAQAIVYYNAIWSVS